MGGLSFTVLGTTVPHTQWSVRAKRGFQVLESRREHTIADYRPPRPQGAGDLVSQPVHTLERCVLFRGQASWVPFLALFGAPFGVLIQHTNHRLTFYFYTCEKWHFSPYGQEPYAENFLHMTVR